REWIQASSSLQVAVNISPQQFFAPEFVSLVLRTLTESGLAPESLELEITEGTVMQDVERAKKVMGALINEGIRFTLDDFGTGYSSLSHIRTLPISGFKIDKSFIDDMVNNRETQAIVSMLVHLARELDLELTVEGVETQKQLDILLEIHPLVLIQGYYFSKPVPPPGFARFLQKQLEGSNPFIDELVT
ncbi:MAG TPA: EAL domain-containing protein, partial [Fibrobacteraceae bacterium]|nr:EAL domain-containing protein [Fibrobacteraceae bacterium]